MEVKWYKNDIKITKVYPTGSLQVGHVLDWTDCNTERRKKSKHRGMATDRQRARDFLCYEGNKITRPGRTHTQANWEPNEKKKTIGLSIIETHYYF